eukprot:TRINITY_DN5633_c0_g1_i40.p1 TRINITY_DN5633_c0_g1~~TRINITY_DN5633_c0_g1_i40.p1  ORF type:complete len:396 (-),score=91.80 TRINITY_DN5633_c0_g1_i40:116-1303(-)
MIVETKKKAPLFAQHSFWNNQLVVKYCDEDKERPQGIIKKLEFKDISTVPTPLPEEFEWCIIDVNNMEEIEEVYKLLKDHYMEYDKGKQKTTLTIDFLRWVLAPPGYFKDCAVGIRLKSTKELIGFANSAPAKISLGGTVLDMGSFSYLCIERRFRAKRLPSFITTELIRRTNLNGVWQSFFTSSKVIFVPFSEVWFYGRVLNYTKLFELEYASIPSGSSLEEEIEKNRLPTVDIKGFREMTKEDVPQVVKILAQYLKRFEMHPVFTEETVEHMFLTKKGIVHSYVVESEKAVTDFVSFYLVYYTVHRHETIKGFSAANLYYYAVTKTPLKELVNMVMVTAEKMGVDTFDTSDSMENKTFIEELKFEKLNDCQHFYFQNYSFRKILPEELGMHDI